ncbi:hypothetical protein BOO71_0011950 [Deinococcus marmoris]|uniref:Uncharacterized protein n=1 Tax=Deinococcus marmoris TaxID=249408 RepID=A0A1U7NTZ8_9DEIO|nr:hypothetical protein BOO71_0011950 [Deinococcus marmoris]
MRFHAWTSAVTCLICRGLIFCSLAFFCADSIWRFWLISGSHFLD